MDSMDIGMCFTPVEKKLLFFSGPIHVPIADHFFQI